MWKVRTWGKLQPKCLQTYRKWFSSIPAPLAWSRGRERVPRCSHRRRHDKTRTANSRVSVAALDGHPVTDDRPGKCSHEMWGSKNEAWEERHAHFLSEVGVAGAPMGIWEDRRQLRAEVLELAGLTKIVETESTGLWELRRISRMSCWQLLLYVCIFMAFPQGFSHFACFFFHSYALQAVLSRNRGLKKPDSDVHLFTTPFLDERHHLQKLNSCSEKIAEQNAKSFPVQYHMRSLLTSPT